MATLMTTCPKTHTPVAVGFETGREFLDSRSGRMGTYKCPHCHELHQWIQQDAWVEESPASHRMTNSASRYDTVDSSHSTKDSR